jgi:hypothetical protein
LFAAPVGFTGTVVVVGAIVGVVVVVVVVVAVVAGATASLTVMSSTVSSETGRVRATSCVGGVTRAGGGGIDVGGAVCRWASRGTGGATVEALGLDGVTTVVGPGVAGPGGSVMCGWFEPPPSARANSARATSTTAAFANSATRRLRQRRKVGWSTALLPLPPGRVT